MNVTVEIKCPDLAEAINNLAAALGNRQLQAPPLESIPNEPTSSGKSVRSAKAKETTPSTSEPETDAGAGEGKETASDQTAAQSPNDESSGTEETLDYAVVKKTVMDLALAKGRGVVVDLLAEFDVPEGKKADAIPAERWPEFVARASEIMG